MPHDRGDLLQGSFSSACFERRGCIGAGRRRQLDRIRWPPRTPNSSVFKVETCVAISASASALIDWTPSLAVFNVLARSCAAVTADCADARPARRRAECLERLLERREFCTRRGLVVIAAHQRLQAFETGHQRLLGAVLGIRLQILGKQRSFLRPADADDLVLERTS